jgi:hypothetical protein
MIAPSTKITTGVASQFVVEQAPVLSAMPTNGRHSGPRLPAVWVRVPTVPHP